MTCLKHYIIINTKSSFRLYHSEDTSIFSDLKLWGKLYRPHGGLILVGNYPGNLAELSPGEAAWQVVGFESDHSHPLLKGFGGSKVFPYGTHSRITEDQRDRPGAG